MDKQIEHYKAQIEAYLMGQLNPTEEAELLSAIAQKDELREELERQEQVVKGFRQIRVERIESMLAGWEEEDEEDSKIQVTPSAKVRPLWRRYGWVAAAGALLLIAFIYYWSIEQRQAYENLVADSYLAPELRDPYSFMSPTTERHPFSVGFDLYFDEEYTEAARYFGTFSPEDSLYEDAQVMRGISLLNTGEYESAINVLEPLYEKAEFEARFLVAREGVGLPRFEKVDLAWQLANAYLGTGQVNNSKALLRRLKQNRNGYQEQASRLLEKIENIEK